MSAKGAALPNGSPAEAFSTPTGKFDLPFMLRFGWGMGTLGPALVMSAFNILMLRFMTDSLGIGVAIAGLLIAGSKLYDAVTDPLVGMLSDRINARASRRRPWLLFGGIGLTASFLLMFIVPTIGNTGTLIAYMTVVLLLYATAYSAFSIPYLAMPVEMTSGHADRYSLMMWRVVAVGIASLAASGLGLAIIDGFGGGRGGHAAMALILAPAVLLSILAAWFFTRHAKFTRRRVGERLPPISEQARQIVTNQPFVILLGVKFLTLSILGMQAAQPFFFNQILNLSDAALGSYFVVQGLVLLSSQWLWVRIGARFGKRLSLIGALVLMTIMSLTWLAAGANDPSWQIYARAVFMGLGQGGVLLMGQAMLPDTIEYDNLRTGLHREGLFSSFYTTVEKVAQAAGVASIGAFLGLMGYVEGMVSDQPDSALWAIRMSVAAFPALMCGCATVLLIFYDLTEERLNAIRAAA